MKSCSWVYMLLTILFATNINQGVSSEQVNHSVVKLDQAWSWSGVEKPPTWLQKFKNEHNAEPKTIEISSEVQKTELKREGRRISETKCLEYIWERNNRAKLERENTSSLFSILLDDVRIFEGREALPTEFPHMGALGWRTINGGWSFKCGSSLISPKFSVTAAHCSKITKESNIAESEPEIVRLGENNIINLHATGVNPIDAEILSIIVHPLYSPRKQYYDIALVELKSEIQFSSYVQPVCLWNSFNSNRLGSEASATGWGKVNTMTKMMSPTLQAAVLDVVDSKKCNLLLRKFCSSHFCGLRSHQLCAGKLTGGVDTCQGDSGGPLQVKINLPSSEEGTMYYLIGVTSFGMGCARPNLPGVYTRVSSFVDWIEKIVWPEE